MVATPPRLGAWATARPGASWGPAAAAASAAAPRRTSRRLTERGWGARVDMVVSFGGFLASPERADRRWMKRLELIWAPCTDAIEPFNRSGALEAWAGV